LSHFFQAFEVGEDGAATMIAGRDASDIVTRIIIAGVSAVCAQMSLQRINTAPAHNHNYHSERLAMAPAIFHK
jgi:hypothetical protein